MTREQFFDGTLSLLGYALLWYLLAGSEGWLFAAPVLLFALVIAHWLKVSRRRLRLTCLPPFLLFFVGTMIAGAWDVARRAWRPARPLSPAWVTGQLRSTSAQVRGLSSAMLGLLPGTLASQLNGQTLEMHVLDQDQDWQTTLSQLEQHIDRLLGTGGR